MLCAAQSAGCRDLPHLNLRQTYSRLEDRKAWRWEWQGSSGQSTGGSTETEVRPGGVYAEGCSVSVCQPRRSVILMVWTTRERCGERASPTCGAVAWRGAFFLFAGAFLPGPLYPAPLR